MPSTTLQKTPKSTLKTSLRTKRDGKLIGPHMTNEEFEAIVIKYGGRPMTPEESRAFRESEARYKAMHSKRLVAA